MRWTRTVGLGLAIVCAAAQLVRPAHTRPVEDGRMTAPPDLLRVLRPACFDCHSSETTWPWYSQVAPLSWMLARDVEAGRQRLNFSAWADYASDPETLAHKFDQIAERVADGSMPPLYYRALHSGARLTAVERALVVAWARAGSTDASGGDHGEGHETDRVDHGSGDATVR
jgi:hypothetical protein